MNEPASPAGRSAADSPGFQFSLQQLMLLVASAGAVFWLCGLVGPAAAALWLGFGANWAVIRVRRCDTLIAGAFWGGLTNAALFVIVSPIIPPLDGIVWRLAAWLYILPGAWFGSVHALLRQAGDLARE